MDSRISQRNGLILAVSVLGGTFVSGREIALFYAQAGSAAWAGIALSAVLLGVFCGVTAALARHTGARSYPRMFGRLLGRYAGTGIAWLHTAAIVLAAVLAADSCARACALMLPLRHAYWIGLCAMIPAALMLAVRRGAYQWTALLLLILFSLLLCALLRLPVPDSQRVYAHVELKLDGSLRAALLLGLLHGFRCCTLAASMVVCDATPQICPVRYGVGAGGTLLLLLLCANAVLQKDGGKLIALQNPFAVLMLGWGKAGYCLLNGMICFSDILLLAGLMRPYLADAEK